MNDYEKKYSLIVTGNGFDIALNLPTRYEDFFNKIVCACNSKNYEEFINKNRDAFLNEKKCLSFYNAVFIQKKNNYFLKYFLAYKTIFERWCDVEREICDIIISIDSFLHKVSLKKVDYSINYTATITDLRPKYIFHKDFINQWHGFIFKTDDDFISGTIVDADYCGNYSRIDLENRFKQIRTTIVDGLSKDFNDFKSLLSLYFDCFVHCNHLIPPKGIKADRLITYNYTQATRIAFNGETPVSVFHIHGQSNSIVLGMDSEHDFYDARFGVFTKVNQRSNNPNIDISEFIGNKPCIAYIGFSFNENDKSTIVEYFKKENATHIIYCLNEKAKNDIIINLKNIIGYEKYNSLYNNDKIQFKMSSELFA